MERSSYPGFVEVIATALQFTESSKSEEILRRYLALGVSGTVSGLITTVNTSNLQRIDITAGSAYVPNGEYVTLSLAQAALSVIDYTNDAYNFVCLVYTETDTMPEAHATDGTARDTRTERAVTVRVFDLTTFVQLPASLADITQIAADRTVVIGVVRGNGPSVALNNPTRITVAPAPQRYATSQQLATITGTVITRYSQLFPTTLTAVKAVSANTLARFTYVASTGLMSVRAPGDTSAGTGVPVSAGGPFPLFTSSMTHSVNVTITPSLLPVSGTTNEDITINSLYEPFPPMGFARDELLRGYAGSGLPTNLNPHGTTISDMHTTSLDLPQTLTLGSALLATDAQAIVARITASMGTTAARTLMWLMPAPAAGNNTRLYANSAGGIGWTINAIWNDATSLWSKDNTAFEAYLVQEGFGFFVLSRPAGAGTWSDSQWTYHITSDPLSVLGGTVSSRGQTVFGENNLATAAAVQIPRIQADFASAAGLQKTLIFRSTLDDGSNGSQTRIYRSQTGAVAASDFFPYEIVSNAVWNETTNLWTADLATTYPSSKFEVSSRGISHYIKSPNTGTWADDSAGWGTVALRADGAFCDAPDFAYTVARRFFTRIFVANFMKDPTFTDVYSGTYSTTDPTGTSANLSKTGAGPAAGWIVPISLPDGAIIPTSASTADAVRIYVTSTVGATSARVALMREVPASGAFISLQSSGTGYTVIPTGLTLGAVNLTIDENVTNRTVSSTSNYYLAFAAAAGDILTISGGYVQYDLYTLRVT